MDSKIKVVLATVLGNIFEYYDFLLFGLAIGFMGDTFLPENIEQKSLWMFLIFAVGFIARPIGSYVLGRVGDIYGRRISILYSIILLSFSTVLIGCLPGYKSIGILSPILLIVLRLVQSFSVSIEQIGGSLFLIETFEKKRRYLSCSLIFGTVYIGAAAGLLMWILVSNFLSHDNLMHWGWRIPFLLSFPLGLSVGMMRYSLAESPEYLAYSKKYPNIYKKTKLKISEITHSAGLFVALAVNSYMTVIYLPTLFHQDQARQINVWILYALGYITIFILSIFFGYLADKKESNANNMLMSALKANIAFAPVIYAWAQSEFFILMMFANLLASALLAIQAATILVSNLDRYDFATRFSTINIGFTLSMTMFGGFAPFIAEYLSKHIHTLAPSLYVMLGTAVTFFVLKFSDYKSREVNYAITTSA